MVILGIHDGHGASAALLVDGRLVAAMSEDRPTRLSTRSGFPFHSVERVLALAGLTMRDVDHIALSTLRLPPKYFFVPRENFSIADFWREQTHYWKPRLDGTGTPAYLEVFADRIDPARRIYDESLIAHEDDAEGMLKARLKHLQAYSGLPAERISVHDHHTCHAWYAYMTHPNRDRDLLVFTTDGGGDGANGTVWEGRDRGALRLLHRDAKCNIGRIYRYATLLLGMKQFEHAFKTMGLAPYANEKYGRIAYDVYAGTLQNHGLGFSYTTQPSDHFFWFKERLEGVRFDGIAWGVQRRTEELLSRWVQNGVGATGIGDVVMSGGVAMNIKANKVIWELPDVTSLFVPPGAGDESLAVGAACIAAAAHPTLEAEQVEHLRPFTTPYLGEDFTDQQALRAIETGGIPEGSRVRQAGAGEVAELLAQGEVVARCAGRWEFGPRALGNRSILADPRNPHVVRQINEIIKQRDFWMPFASSVLEERADDYFINPKGLDARYMTLAFDSTPLGRKEMISGLHPYDHTSRPHVVSRAVNPDYHALISAFQERTGVGTVLNTSFNLHGEPMVAGPEDAVSTWVRSGLSHVWIGSWLVSKPVHDSSQGGCHG
ncbi:MAG: carbamoyltransferase [Magnetococcales bacterium]|nr:carbamoyltransferase [Magnetococcales bacterium]